MRLQGPLLSRDQAAVSIVYYRLGIKLIECLQFEVVHGQAQIGELGLGGGVSQARFHPFGRAVEAFTQGPVHIGIAQFAKQSPDFFRSSPGLPDQPQCGRKGDPAGLRVLEHAALEHPTLPRPVRVDPAGAILAQGRARLGKTCDRLPAARKRDRQPEPLQFSDIVLRFEFDEVEKRPVAAQAACAAEVFA
jgi:hypothetical protein